MTSASPPDHVGLRVLLDLTSAHGYGSGDVDIVAVHGLGADPNETWCCESTKVKHAKPKERLVEKTDVSSTENSDAIRPQDVTPAQAKKPDEIGTQIDDKIQAKKPERMSLMSRLKARLTRPEEPPAMKATTTRETSPAPRALHATDDPLSTIASPVPGVSANTGASPLSDNPTVTETLPNKDATETSETNAEQPTEPLSPKVNWLTHQSMLPGMIPTARIISLEYNLDWRADRNVIQKLYGISDRLLHALLEAREMLIRYLRYRESPDVQTVAGAIFLGTPLARSRGGSCIKMPIALAKRQGLPLSDQESHDVERLVKAFSEEYDHVEGPKPQFLCFVHEDTGVNDMMVDETVDIVPFADRAFLDCDEVNINKFGSATDPNLLLLLRTFRDIFVDFKRDWQRNEFLLGAPSQLAAGAFGGSSRKLKTNEPVESSLVHWEPCYEIRNTNGAGRLSKVSFAREGKALFIVFQQAKAAWRVRMFSILEPVVKFELMQEFVIEAANIEISPTGSHIAGHVTHREGVSVWDVPTESLRPRQRLEPSERSRCVDGAPGSIEDAPFCFSSDGLFLAEAIEEGGVHIHNLVKPWVSQILPSAFPARPLTAISVLTFSDDGSMLAAGTRNGRVILWSTDQERLLAVFDGQPGRITKIFFYGPENGDHICALWGNGSVRHFELTYARSQHQISSKKAVDLQVCPEGRRIAILLFDGCINMRDSEERQAWPIEVDARADRITFSQDAKLIACYGRRARGSRLWNIASGAVHQTLSEDMEIAQMCFSPDGKMIAAISLSDNVVQVWRGASERSREFESREIRYSRRGYR